MYDLLDLLEDITRPAYDGPAPLGFTSRYCRDQLEMSISRVKCPRDVHLDISRSSNCFRARTGA